MTAVARVHRNFYSSDTDEVEVNSDERSVSTTWIQPIGLLTNELVTNAAKHGGGKLVVICKADGTAEELWVCDEGEGVPKNFNPA